MFVTLQFYLMRLIFIFLVSLSLISLGSTAQKRYFIYVESELKEPFYVLINGKYNYSSSLNGFLIIPQINASTYYAEIGFVGNKYPEQHFTITINDQDLGYLLRKASDNTFNLLNLQSFSTLNINGKTKTNNAIDALAQLDAEIKKGKAITDSTSSPKLKKDH